MSTSKYKSPHDRALIAFASGVLSTLEAHHDWSIDTLDDIEATAEALGLSTSDDEAQFRVIPRERFRNRLGL
jgi:hypothetical protein